METSAIDSYLHKKFKKQLSVDPKPYHHASPRLCAVEPRAQETAKCNQVTDNQRDNTNGVPNQSTNHNSPAALNFSKSSISAPPPERCPPANQQSPTNTCISYAALEPAPKSSIDGPRDQAPGGKYVCPYCNLVCSKPSVLQKHIRAHTNERPYPCSSCGFSFKTRSNLYKHCRSRTHANRVMGNKVHEEPLESAAEPPSDPKAKPYKPRFHTAKENEEKPPAEESINLLSDHINEIINKNNSIVNSNDSYLLKRREPPLENNNEEPLNLTSKNRKRCLSEVVEPVAQKSLIKELLLKNLSSDMQCPHCKMIFQTVTELELHKLRSCKGFVKPGAKYSRSSSVNVASILTQNKNAFDNIPHLQNTAFPLKSPGPFLGKTRLVDSDKNKSFSFDDGLANSFPMPSTNHDRYLLSPLTFQNEREKKTPLKMFGGEVKITHKSGETKSFKIDNKDPHSDTNFVEYAGKLSENRVVKSGLQSGGTVLTNKANYPKQEAGTSPDVIRVYDNTAASPSIDISTFTPSKFHFEPEHFEQISVASPSYNYTTIMDFSQKALKLLTPKLNMPNLAAAGIPMPSKFTFPPICGDGGDSPQKFASKASPACNPMNLLVNGQVVRYVPGIPGPVLAEEAELQPTIVSMKRPSPRKASPPKSVPVMEALEINTDFAAKPLPPPPPPMKSPGVGVAESKKFSRPNSLALKPTTASLKQHHGLTPTMFNQILISPDTPRVAKKYAQHFLHGNYFSYLGLKSSTKMVYCTLNKTQPFYVPHFKKLSMYSEWRQQDTKEDKLYVSAYDSRQSDQRVVMAGASTGDLMVHSSYKFVVSESLANGERGDEQLKASAILGGYECNDDYTYVRGRGRGRYVCDQCGIRCKKPSMLKKHIRTHSNDRPYTCSHCNFSCSFKTKGNLTKHMKSKAHTKNYAASGSGSSTQHSGTQSSDSDTDDSGMDSSDESTRREEHEAAYGLLSLAQKSTQRREADSPNSSINDCSNNIMNTEEIAHVSNRNYAKNKTMDDTARITFSSAHNVQEDIHSLAQFLGKTSISRPLTYPYTTALTEAMDIDARTPDGDTPEPKCIKQFHVIQKYAAQTSPAKPTRSPEFYKTSSPKDRPPLEPPILKVNDTIVSGEPPDVRKRKLTLESSPKAKLHKNDEVMDLSMPIEKAVAPRYHNGELEREPGDLGEYAPPVFRHNEYKNNGGVVVYNALHAAGNLHYVIAEPQPLHSESPKSYKSVEYDNSAMETLADIATKQVKLEKNTLAKSVASEFLKIATKNEFEGSGEHHVFGPAKDMNELMGKPEGSKCCNICAKSFSKTSQLRLHMNIHYLERPFRCHSCSVSFRTKGHLQKHERSASHHNKLSSSPALSSSEPRPFKCVDCNIAFRIHGHLAKHLRSKMHIMKLECLAKIPFGLYAELERSNSLLTEINTADGDQCLESLKTLAKKVFINDPNKLNHLIPVENIDADS